MSHSHTSAKTWNAVIPPERWFGFRHSPQGISAFESLSLFEEALVNEVNAAFSDHELVTLSRLLKPEKKIELEVFTRTHGPNPLFNPYDEFEPSLGIAKAEAVDLNRPASYEAASAILDGQVVHVLFQAGEASRFQEGPFYLLNPLRVAESMDSEAVTSFLSHISDLRKKIPVQAALLLCEEGLGPKQALMIRAALRRVVQSEIDAGRLALDEAQAAYQRALRNQKLLFFVSERGDVNRLHDEALRKRYRFFGFDPSNLVTIEQELVYGVTVDEKGAASIFKKEGAQDAAGHLYALLQAVRPGSFTTYTPSGSPVKPMEQDALGFLYAKGGRILNIIRINDMDRHTTEIINTKALSYALKKMEAGYVNIIESVSNPSGQKGGVGTTFGDAHMHVLTETHENSFPNFSRAFEKAMAAYMKENQNQPPSYNAMRQWADLAATRRALREFGGRIVIVPRTKTLEGEEVLYLGADMPMGDLSLLGSDYKSHLFQLVDGQGRGLHIHDVKQKENLSIALRTMAHQLQDSHILAAALELAGGPLQPFAETAEATPLYGAPAPEFENGPR